MADQEANSFVETIQNIKKFWEPIGGLVFSFGYLERDVDWAICAFLRLDYLRLGETIVGQIRNLTSRIELLNALCRMMTDNEGHREQMKDITKGLRDLNNFRNNLVHGAFSAFLVEEEAWVKMGVNPNSMKLTAFQTTVPEILENQKQAVRLGSDLTNLVQEIMKGRSEPVELPASPDTSP